MTSHPNATFETLLDCLAHWAHIKPTTVYLTQPVNVTDVIEYTWSEVNDEVKRMAAYLQSLNLPAHSRIGILGKNSAHWIMADLAIWMAGHISVPIYPTVNADTAHYVLEHSQAELLFVGKMDELWPIVQAGIPAEIRKVCLPLAPAIEGVTWNDVIASIEPTSSPVKRSQHELATIIYTSGSTGQPKGVMITFGAMVAAVNGIANTLCLRGDDRMLSYLHLAHAAERAIVQTSSLYYGISVFFAYNLDTFLQDLNRAKPTLFFSVPRLWTRFYNGISQKLSPRLQSILFATPVLSGVVKRRILAKLGLQHVRLALSGSAPLAPTLINWYRELGLELLEGYAMTENFAYSHGNRPGDNKEGYVGAPYPGVECRISDEGEVLVKSPANMAGYYNNPELTALAFTEDGFLKTGDMGQTDSDNRLKITGRIKELFKTSKGKYVAPVPIENLLAGNVLVEAVCVTGPSLNQPIGLIMLSQSAQRMLAANNEEKSTIAEQLEALIRHVNQHVEAHEKLACLVVVKDLWSMENGLLTPTMKIKRNLIEGRYLPKASAWLSQRSPVVFET